MSRDNSRLVVVVVVVVVELEGIEPSSVEWSPDRDTTIPALRPRRLPHRRVGGARGLTAGSFPDVSGLSRRQRSLPPSTTASVAGLRWSGPVRHCWSR